MKNFIFLALFALTLIPVSAWAIEPGIPVPEPSSLIFIVTGLVGVLGARKIFKK